MSVAFADYDDDGLMDIFGTHDTQANFFHSRGDETFEKVTIASGWKVSRELLRHGFAPTWKAAGIERVHMPGRTLLIGNAVRKLASRPLQDEGAPPSVEAVLRSQN